MQMSADNITQRQIKAVLQLSALFIHEWLPIQIKFSSFSNTATNNKDCSNELRRIGFYCTFCFEIELQDFK
jgi:hypothetical protein